ncbi:DivIVA domain-containing protein [Bifidobacterium sp. ESL0704]|uniref:DivIVA domain-containing protein n=1 Tax=Bifidobacterium sp. ESL0704 TaxID=2983219 RepID=UPI0023F84148|nr:DivIVA domain-containing protein [Bifidobacterium sp. ESL0704]WEV53408.1 DivIVA domain-containing protein [Bifidobacterium sp. ESL0704]
MAEESENNQSSTGIEYAGKRKWGYDIDQVNEFLERAHEMYDRNDGELTQQDIQSAAFTFTKGGYVIAEVDAALARLEHAVVDKETARQITGDGAVAWQARTQQLYNMISAHAKRGHKDRFMRGEKKRPSYDVKQVDRLVDQIITKSSDDLDVRSMSSEEAKDLADLNSSTVANVIFTQRKGSRGYDERQVDYYLDACVQLLSRVESYARITDYNAKNAAAASATQPVETHTVPVVAQSQPVSGLDDAPVSPLIADNALAPSADPTIPAAHPHASSYQPAEPAPTTQPAASSSSPDAFQTNARPTSTDDFGAASPSTFDFNMAVPDTAAPVIPNLPDGVGTQGGTANASAPSQSSATDASSSLAALANMTHGAEASSNSAEQASFATPQVPTLGTPVQSNGNNGNADAGAASLFGDADRNMDTKPATSLNDPDVDIPDISFPDYSAFKSDDQKTGE